MSLLRRIEKSLDQRLRALFGGSNEGPGSREAIELYHDALDQIGRRAAGCKRPDKVLAFNVITVELVAANAERRSLLEAVFDPAQMTDDALAVIAQERFIAPPDFRVEILYREEAPTELRVSFVEDQRPGKEPVGFPMDRMLLRTLTGGASCVHYIVEHSYVSIGRESLVVDAQGRTIRANNLYFPEGEHEANATVSRMHAHIKFEPETGEWRIYDEGSSLGTAIFRYGTRIPVPAHSSRGVLLRPRDEIYLGQVQLRFEVI